MHNVRPRDLERAASKRGQQVKIRLLNLFLQFCGLLKNECFWEWYSCNYETYRPTRPILPRFDATRLFSRGIMHSVYIDCIYRVQIKLMIIKILWHEIIKNRGACSMVWKHTYKIRCMLQALISQYPFLNQAIQTRQFKSTFRFILVKQFPCLDSLNQTLGMSIWETLQHPSVLDLSIETRKPLGIFFTLKTHQ
jgi:hypothetical protein